MSSLLSQKLGCSSGHVPHGDHDDTMDRRTEKTIDELDNEILPLSLLGVKIRGVNVFWTPFTRNDISGGNNNMLEIDESDDDDDLKAARPPDGILLPIWRTCHMGIILEAYNDEDKTAASLNIAIELFRDGIHISHSFGTALKTKKQIVQNLRNQYSEDHPIFSAGVKQDVEVDLEVLFEAVHSFRDSTYNLLAFNCQHFASIVFFKLTKKILSEMIRKRWTGGSGGWGVPLRRRGRAEENGKAAMAWASSSSLLMEQLHPVEGEPYLFSRSPPRVGGATKLAAGAAVLLAERNPMAGAALAAGSLLLDRVPQIRRFERSTIWFRYSPEKQGWFWTPYRHREVMEDDRWIPIHQLHVQHGRFRGRQLRGKSQTIANLLVDMDPMGDLETCPICMEAALRSTFCQGARCDHTICKTCFAQLEICPFCRSPYTNCEQTREERPSFRVRRLRLPTPQWP